MPLTFVHKPAPASPEEVVADNAKVYLITTMPDPPAPPLLTT
jgi:hypothetical protein